MSENVQEMIVRWSREHSPDFDASSLFAQVDYLARKLFGQYLPTAAPEPSFHRRLEGWLSSPRDDGHRKAMLAMAASLFFVGRDEFLSLYQAAYRNCIIRWLMDILEIRCDDEKGATRIEEAVARTWFCPITDSMQIAQFCHVNHIAGSTFRPDWRSLAYLIKKDKPDFISFLESRYERVVLLEDFVGSGNQWRSALDFALSLPCDIPFLLVPLVVCPKGADMGRRYERSSKGKSGPRLRFEPVLELPAAAFVTEMALPDEDPTKAMFRRLLVETYNLVDEGRPPKDDKKPYGPFGYSRTGGLVVPYSNTPDNTAPIIGHSSRTWPCPLFPRSSR